MTYTRKLIPRSIVVFGASDHIGGPLAEFLMSEAPHIQLRLVTSSETKAEPLRQQFPSAELVVATYTDVATLVPAVADMEGAFVITPPSGLDERACTINLVAAFQSAGTLLHMVRLMGLHPDENPAHFPDSLRLNREDPHRAGRKVLEKSGLPVTFLNSGATYMDNFFRLGMGATVRETRRLVWPEHIVPWIDPRDLAEVAGRLLLSDNHRHIGQFHTANNGHDLMGYQAAAELMSDVFNEKIAYDGSREAFFAAYSHLGPARNVIWDYMQYEQDNEVVWSLNDFSERMLGRRPRTLRQWLAEHQQRLLGEC